MAELNNRAVCEREEGFSKEKFDLWYFRILQWLLVYIVCANIAYYPLKSSLGHVSPMLLVIMTTCSWELLKAVTWLALVPLIQSFLRPLGVSPPSDLDLVCDHDHVSATCQPEVASEPGHVCPTCRSNDAIEPGHVCSTCQSDDASEPDHVVESNISVVEPTVTFMTFASLTPHGNMMEQKTMLPPVEDSC